MLVLTPLTPLRTVPFALTGTSATDVYTVGDQGEAQLVLLGVMVTDATGSIATPIKLVLYRIANTTEYVLSPATVGLPTASENFVWTGCVWMARGDEVRVTGASGHHVFTTFMPIGLDQGVSAQR